MNEGQPMPVGWGLDGAGQSTTDPLNVTQRGGSMTPLGGTREGSSYKGYGLSAMVNILSSCLSGATLITDPMHTKKPQGFEHGHFFLALDPRLFRDEGAFEEDVAAFCASLRASRPAEDGVPVLVAGDPQWEIAEKRSREGIPIGPGLRAKLRKVAADAGVAWTLDEPAAAEPYIFQSSKSRFSSNQFDFRGTHDDRDRSDSHGRDRLRRRPPLGQRGARVTTSLAGRSAGSAERARSAGVQAVSDRELVEGAEIFLSIVPPASAPGIAERFLPLIAEASRKPVFIDCNAIAPQTLQGIAEGFGAKDLPFLDGSIIGPPPKPDGSSPRLYVSGPAGPAPDRLGALGLDVRVVSDKLGDASALKMAYAGITKGLQGLGTGMVLGAWRNGVGERFCRAGGEPAAALRLADARVAADGPEGVSLGRRDGGGDQRRSCCREPAPPRC